MLADGCSAQARGRDWAAAVVRLLPPPSVPLRVVGHRSWCAAISFTDHQLPLLNGCRLHKTSRAGPLATCRCRTLSTRSTSRCAASHAAAVAAVSQSWLVTKGERGGCHPSCRRLCWRRRRRRGFIGVRPGVILMTLWVVFEG